MMGMTLGLDKPGQCTQANLAKAMSLVPKALEPYVVDILNGVGRGGEDVSATNGGTPNANTGGSGALAATPSTSGMDLLQAAVAAAGSSQQLQPQQRAIRVPTKATSYSDEDDEEEEEDEFNDDKILN